MSRQTSSPGEERNPSSAPLLGIRPTRPFFTISLFSFFYARTRSFFLLRRSRSDSRAQLADHSSRRDYIGGEAPRILMRLPDRPLPLAPNSPVCDRQTVLKIIFKGAITQPNLRYCNKMSNDRLDALRFAF